MTFTQAWVDRAVCKQTADPEAWWTVNITAEVRQICCGCPVRSECLQYAFDNNERYGIWGGLSEGERASLKSEGHTTIQFEER